VTRKGVHALALQVSGIPLTAVATRMSAPAQPRFGVDQPCCPQIAKR
jgi:hypothetical protein